MTLYLDNDVIAKLAACDLLHEALASLESKTDDVRILSTLKYRYGLTNPQRRLKHERELGTEVLSRIESFVNSTGEIAAADPAHLQAFEDTPAIDAGEAQLYSSAASDAGGLAVTGDKRSITSLATALACKEIAAQLQGRVICFEQVIQKVIADSGFETIKRKIVPAVDCDTALRAAFGSGLAAEERQVMRVLSAYVDDLRSKSGQLLATLTLGN